MESWKWEAKPPQEGVQISVRLKPSMLFVESKTRGQDERVEIEEKKERQGDMNERNGRKRRCTCQI